MLGGCRGSTGPSSLARDGKPWGSRFPKITVRDQVEADVAALAALGITEVAAVLGGSMGGARALEWIVSHPDQVGSALLLAVSARPPPTKSAPRAPRLRLSRPTRTGRAVTTTTPAANRWLGWRSPVVSRT
ncbi:homoserine O-acetyltransferase [Mycobacterium xenopi 3993]|nr:homoserine O-acetyltransferase [Mycobacterium xenopi 3993]